MCSQESHRRRIMTPLGTVVGLVDNRAEDMVDGKGVLTAMMDDDNAKKKFQVRVKNLARFCPNKEGHILCLLERVGDGPIIIYL